MTADILIILATIIVTSIIVISSVFIGYSIGLAQNRDE